LIHPLLELLFYFTLMFSFWSFANNFITFPLIQKHMMPKDPDPDDPESDDAETVPLEIPDQVDDRLFKKDE
jgi:hypothetical protein